MIGHIRYRFLPVSMAMSFAAFAGRSSVHICFSVFIPFPNRFQRRFVASAWQNPLSPSRSTFGSENARCAKLLEKKKPFKTKLYGALNYANKNPFSKRNCTVRSIMQNKKPFQSETVRCAQLCKTTALFVISDPKCDFSCFCVIFL